MGVVSRQSSSGIHNIPSIFDISCSIFDIFTAEYVRDKICLFPPARPNIIMEIHETFLED